MAQRRVEVGEKVRIRHGVRKGRLGVVVDHERHTRETWDSWRRRPDTRTVLTYEVEIEGVGIRRFPGSHLDLVKTKNKLDLYEVSLPSDVPQA